MCWHGNTSHFKDYIINSVLHLVHSDELSKFHLQVIQ